MTHNCSAELATNILDGNPAGEKYSETRRNRKLLDGTCVKIFRFIIGFSRVGAVFCLNCSAGVCLFVRSFWATGLNVYCELCMSVCFNPVGNEFVRHRHTDTMRANKDSQMRVKERGVRLNKKKKTKKNKSKKHT